MDSKYLALVFEYGGVPGLKNGFYELSSNGTKTSEKSIAPLPSIFGGVNGASPCDDTSTDCLIFYGSIQYSSPNLVGNLFRFNFTSQSWTIFAKGNLHHVFSDKKDWNPSL